MRNINQQIAIFSVVVILLCFLAVIIFTLPSLIGQFNLSTKGNIGDAIGGITAPLIGIISSILLYMALSRQVESNIDQRLKNESDIIFLLLNQLDSEISNFYFKYNEGKEGKEKEEIKYYGIEGLNEFTRKFRWKYKLNDFDFTFKRLYEANQILLIIRSYILIEKRIELSSLSHDLKKLFNNKLKAIYDCRLKNPFKNINVAFEEHVKMKDEVTDEIQGFIKLKSS